MIIDLIVKLPLSKELVSNIYYDNILSIVDRLTKYMYFLPFKESYIAEDLMYIVICIIVSNYGLFTEFITDRGTTFTLKFWQSLSVRFGINHKLSIAFHL